MCFLQVEQLRRRARNADVVLSIVRSCRPSSLQPLLKRREHTLSSLCMPHMDISGLHYTDISIDRAGGLVPQQEGIFQCTLSLGTVSGIPSSG